LSVARQLLAGAAAAAAPASCRQHRRAGTAALWQRHVVRLHLVARSPILSVLLSTWSHTHANKHQPPKIMSTSKAPINVLDLNETLPSSTGNNIVSTQHCWSRDVEHTYDQKMNPSMPSISDAITQIPQSIRFFTTYYVQEKWAGRVPTFDPFVHNVSEKILLILLTILGCNT
jgi:hypothetical protein